MKIPNVHLRLEDMLIELSNQLLDVEILKTQGLVRVSYFPHQVTERFVRMDDIPMAILRCVVGLTKAVAAQLDPTQESTDATTDINTIDETKSQEAQEGEALADFIPKG